MDAFFKFARLATGSHDVDASSTFDPPPPRAGPSFKSPGDDSPILKSAKRPHEIPHVPSQSDKTAVVQSLQTSTDHIKNPDVTNSALRINKGSEDCKKSTNIDQDSPKFEAIPLRAPANSWRRALPEGARCAPENRATPASDRDGAAYAFLEFEGAKGSIVPSLVPIAEVSREVSPEAPSCREDPAHVPPPTKISATDQSSTSGPPQERSGAVKLTVRLPTVVQTSVQVSGEDASSREANLSKQNTSSPQQRFKGTDSNMSEIFETSEQNKPKFAPHDTSYVSEFKRHSHAETPVHTEGTQSRTKLSLPPVPTTCLKKVGSDKAHEMRIENDANASRSKKEPAMKSMCDASRDRPKRNSKLAIIAKSKSRGANSDTKKAPKKEKPVTCPPPPPNIPKNPYETRSSDAAARKQLDQAAAGADAAASQRKSYLCAVLQPKAKERPPHLPNSTQNRERKDMKTKSCQNAAALASLSRSLVRPIPKPRTDPPRPWPRSRFPPPLHKHHLDQQERATPRSSASAGSGSSIMSRSINNISKPNRPSAFDRVYKSKPPPKPKQSALRERIGACVEAAEAEMMLTGSDPPPARVVSRSRLDTDSLDVHIVKLEQELRDIEQKLPPSDLNSTSAHPDQTSTLIVSPETSKRRPTSLLNRMEGVKAFTEIARMRKRECALLEQLHTLTEANEAVAQCELILTKHADELENENTKLKERASLLEMLYLEQVDVVEEQAKVVHELRQVHIPPAGASYSYRQPAESLRSQSALRHMREDFSRLQSSYHNLAAENSMLHTKLKALTGSFRVASQTMLLQGPAQMNDRLQASDTHGLHVFGCASSIQSANGHSIPSSEPKCARPHACGNGQIGHGVHDQLVQPHAACGRPSRCGVSTALPAA